MVSELQPRMIAAYSRYDVPALEECVRRLHRASIEILTSEQVAIRDKYKGKK